MQYTIDQPHFQTVAVYSIIKNGFHGDAKTK